MFMYMCKEVLVICYEIHNIVHENKQFDNNESSEHMSVYKPIKLTNRAIKSSANIRALCLSDKLWNSPSAAVSCNLLQPLMSAWVIRWQWLLNWGPLKINWYITWPLTLNQTIQRMLQYLKTQELMVQ